MNVQLNVNSDNSNPRYYCYFCFKVGWFKKIFLLDEINFDSNRFNEGRRTDSRYERDKHSENLPKFDRYLPMHLTLGYSTKPFMLVAGEFYI